MAVKKLDKRRTTGKLLIKDKAFSIIKKVGNKELDKLADMTEGRLFAFSSVFPFDFFPNQIIIEQKQIVIIYRQFFWSSQEYHVLIEDILTPIVENGVFFSTLKLQLGPGGFQQDPPPISFLKKAEASKAKRIIVGLLICHKEKIDFSGMKPSEIVKKVEEIGRFKRN